MATYVVCVDGSTNSDDGLRLANACANCDDSIVICCSAEPIDGHIANMFETMIAADMNQAINFDIQAATEAVQHSISLIDRPFSTRILHSTSQDAASSVCDEFDGKCDVIVVGSRGLGRAAQFFMGSFSSSVVARCRESAVLITPPIHPPMKYDGIVRCVCLVDGSGAALRCIRVLAKLLHHRDCVCFMNCVPQSPNAAVQCASVQAGEAHGVSAVHEYRTAGGLAQQVFHNIEAADDVHAAALRFVADNSNGMGGPVTYIAVGSRGRRPLDPVSLLLGSTARSLLNTGKFPILVLTSGQA